jgi:hypothetical protein
MKRKLGLAVVAGALAVALALAVTACGGGADDNGVASVNPTTGQTTSSDAPSAHADGVAFARCIRRHGVNMPDPDPEIQWGQLEQAPGWEAAWEACRQLLPPGPTTPPPSAQEMRQLLAYARCMRAHHVEISDPDPAHGDMTLSGYSRAQQQTDPVFKAAHAACKDKLPGGAQWQPGQTKKRGG